MIGATGLSVASREFGNLREAGVIGIKYRQSRARRASQPDTMTQRVAVTLTDDRLIY
jgi:hypothetical protein